MECCSSVSCGALERENSRTVDSNELLLPKLVFLFLKLFWNVETIFPCACVVINESYLLVQKKKRKESGRKNKEILNGSLGS